MSNLTGVSLLKNLHIAVAVVLFLAITVAATAERAHAQFMMGEVPGMEPSGQQDAGGERPPAPELYQGQIADLEENLVIDMTPQQPGPETPVTVQVRSFLLELDRATITWRVNGQLGAQGVGERRFDFETGPVGSASTISVTVVTHDGRRVERDVTVRPGSVMIGWEAHTYTPPFYRGKALPTSQSPVTLTAMPLLIGPAGAVLDPSTLTYTWKRDGRVLAQSSGRGRQSITINAPIRYQSAVYSVDVASPDRSLRASGNIAVRPHDPEIVFYENSPLRGVRYERALSEGMDFDGTELVVRAEPYYFARENVAELTYSWSVSGRRIPAEEAPAQEITLRQEPGTSGLARVSLMVNNTRKLLQNASRAITINLRDGFAR